MYTDQTVTAPIEPFGRKDTVFLSVVSDGIDPAVVLRARWYGPKGNVLQEVSQTVSSVGLKATAFHLDHRSGLAVGKSRSRSSSTTSRPATGNSRSSRSCQ